MFTSLPKTFLGGNLESMSLRRIEKEIASLGVDESFEYVLDELAASNDVERLQVCYQRSTCQRHAFTGQFLVALGDYVDCLHDYETCRTDIDIIHALSKAGIRLQNATTRLLKNHFCRLVAFARLSELKEKEEK